MSEMDVADEQGARARGTRHSVEIAGADLNFRPFDIVGQSATGRQIAEAFGVTDVKGVIVLQQLPNRDLESLRPSEAVDIGGPASKRFIVVVSDRSYRLAVDALSLEWPFADPTAGLLKKLVGADDDVELVQILADGSERTYRDDDHVRLDGDKTERFRTRRKPPTKVKVTYNHDPYELEARIYTTEELRRLFGVPDGYIFELIGPDCQFIPLKPGEKIKIREGMAFVSHAPSGGSS